VDERPVAGGPGELDSLVVYLRDHTARYNRTALERQLLEAGYSPDQVAEGWRRLAAEDRAAGIGDRRLLVALLVAGAYVGVWLLYAGIAATTRVESYLDFRGLAALVLGVLLLVPLAVTILAVRFHRGLQRSTVAAALGVLVIPIVLLVGIAGTCFATFPPV
jgi:hypothetical protein